MISNKINNAQYFREKIREKTCALTLRKKKKESKFKLFCITTVMLFLKLIRHHNLKLIIQDIIYKQKFTIQIDLVLFFLIHLNVYFQGKISMWDQSNYIK